MLPHCCSRLFLSLSLYLFLLALLVLNLKALTNRKTFPTVNKHANKSTQGALGFSVYIQSFTKDTYRRSLSLLLFYF